MATTPAGEISLAQEALRDTLAAVTAFRTWTATARAATAKARIYNDGLPLPANNRATLSQDEWIGYRPCALVYTPETNGIRYRRDSRGTANEFITSGRLILELSQTVADADADDIAEAEVKWRNVVGQILDGLAAIAGSDEYLDISEMALVRTARASDEDIAEFGDYQLAVVEILWGEGDR